MIFGMGFTLETEERHGSPCLQLNHSLLFSISSRQNQRRRRKLLFLLPSSFHAAFSILVLHFPWENTEHFFPLSPTFTLVNFGGWTRERWRTFNPFSCCDFLLRWGIKCFKMIERHETWFSVEIYDLETLWNFTNVKNLYIGFQCENGFSVKIFLWEILLWSWS